MRTNRLTVTLALSLVLAACGGAGSGADPASSAASSTGANNISPGTSGTSGNTPSSSGTSPGSALSWSTPATISKTAASYPDLAIASDGFAVAVYVQPVNAGGTNALYGVVRQPGSNQWSTPVSLSAAGESPVTVTPASGNLATPAANRVVVNRTTGDATVAWIDQASAAYPAGQSIYIASYQRSSNSWSTPTRLGYASSTPALSINRKGDVVLAYMAPGATADAPVIQGDVIASGKTTSFGPIAAGHSDGTPPQVSIDGSDNVNVAWSAWDNSSAFQLLAARRLANNTVGATQVVAGSSSTNLQFSLAASDNGASVIGVARNQQIYTARLPAGAINWQAPMYVAGGTVNFYPTVSTNSNGDAVLVFSAANTTNASYYERAPWVATYSAASNSWTTASQIASATNGVGQPKVWLGDDSSVFLSMRGTAIMSWRRGAAATNWTQTIHDLTGVAPVSAADPVTGAAALVWLDSNTADNMVGLLAEVWH
jgi:hypothetical protein